MYLMHYTHINSIIVLWHKCPLCPRHVSRLAMYMIIQLIPLRSCALHKVSKELDMAPLKSTVCSAWNTDGNYSQEAEHKQKSVSAAL